MSEWEVSVQQVWMVYIHDTGVWRWCS